MCPLPLVYPEQQSRMLGIGMWKWEILPGEINICYKPCVGLKLVREQSAQDLKKTAYLQGGLPQDLSYFQDIVQHVFSLRIYIRVKAALSELAQESWARHLESLDPQDNSLWKTQRALRLPARSKIPPIHGTRGVVYTNQEKAEAFADSLELQCRLPLLPDEDEEFKTTTHRTLLQNSLDRLETWCNRWRVKINPDKSTAVLFTKRQIPLDLDDLTLTDEPIPWNRQARYLGVTMDQRLTWKPHIVVTVARARATRARLYPLHKGNNTLSLRNKRTLIKVVLQAQLTYACTAWGHAAKSHIKTLQAVENIALRTATASPWYVRNADILRDLQYTNATQTIRTNAQKRFDQATTHDNPSLDKPSSTNTMTETNTNDPDMSLSIPVNLPSLSPH
ncbi:hypothetical protein NQ315_014673 [Exocentrus adspersus]|uniref:Reverse transcriptase n=1 Tax=Exocentrus adspersus TaxID=1586481 RepID=A0AAV8VPV1_9CUCU|nr:hypothetical protein NQ315_014673 [Exocentrus adspersus]